MYEVGDAAGGGGEERDARQGRGTAAAAEETIDIAGVEDEDVQVEEAHAAKPLRGPCTPSAAEKAAHEATHLPFRSWCPECVAGRRNNPPHRTIKDQDDSTVPEVMLDYAFIRREDEEHTLTILVMKDRGSRAVQAWRVEKKGAEDPDEVSRAVEGVRRFGHRGKILLKTDGEPAILALKEKMMQSLSDGAISIESPPHESESNGAVDNGVKLVKGLLRVHLMA
jgi:hypothetical protein